MVFNYSQLFLIKLIFISALEFSSHLSFPKAIFPPIVYIQFLSYMVYVTVSVLCFS